MRSTRPALLPAAVLAWLCLACGAWAQDAPAPPEPLPEAATVEARIAEAEADATMDTGLRDRLLEAYRKALAHIESARAHAAAAAGFAAARETASRDVARLREALEQPDQVSRKPDLPADAPPGVIEETLGGARAELATLEARLAELDRRLSQHAARPDVASARIAEARGLVAQIDEELAAAAPPPQPAALAQARRWSLEWRRESLLNEIRMLEQELLGLPQRRELRTLERELTARNLAAARARVRGLEEALGQRRLQEAEAARAEAAAARREAQGKHPAIQEAARSNSELGEQIARLAARLEQVQAEQNTAADLAARFEEDFRRAQERLRIAGLSEAFGRVLRELRRQLPDAAAFGTDAQTREEAAIEAGLRQIRYQEERDRLRDPEAAARGLLPPGAEPAPALIAQLREVLARRQALLDKAVELDGAYLRALGELDFAHRRLAEAVATYDAFLTEHLLWTPSLPPVSLGSFAGLPAAVAWLARPGHWVDTLELLGRHLLAAPWWLPAVLPVLLLLWYHRRLRALLEDIALRVRRPATDHIALTFRALGITALLALPGPLLLGAVGLFLARSAGAESFPAAVASAILVVAPTYFYLRALSVFLVRNGVAEAHFQWPRPTLAVLRREIRRLTVVLLPLAFLSVVAGNAGRPADVDSFARMAFVAMMATLAFFFFRVLRPSRGALTPYAQLHPRSWLARLRHVWPALATGVPLILAGEALAGYLYSAGVLTRSLVNTIWLVLAALIVHQLTLRWLVLARRQLAIQAARERREKARAAGTREEESAGGEIGTAAEEPPLDLAAVDAQSRRLVNTLVVVATAAALWTIWAGVVPALGILDDVSLWHYTRTVEGEDLRVPVTLADLGTVFLLLLLTGVAARNLPGLMEIAFLQRLGVTSGSRYATVTLSRYAIVAIGVIVMFNTVGGDWGQIQWLVAALGVGIGFGLQEIVANFISGLIILFERPIRVGDIVTVGDTSGVVTKIRIRATTITNWDKQELLVPNKEFITGRLLNWSLSDQVSRLVIPVGVAYGSDVRKALDLMLESAEEHPRVVDEPKAFVTFESFGDNALGLVLRCYLDSLDYRLATISELHEAINRKFAEAGLVIAFPQRDVHLATPGPLDIRLHRARAAAPPEGSAPAGPDAAP